MIESFFFRACQEKEKMNFQKAECSLSTNRVLSSLQVAGVTDEEKQTRCLQNTRKCQEGNATHVTMLLVAGSVEVAGSVKCHMLLAA